jgi:hypothetical protein
MAARETGGLSLSDALSLCEGCNVERHIRNDP